MSVCHYLLIYLTRLIKPSSTEKGTQAARTSSTEKETNSNIVLKFPPETKINSSQNYEAPEQRQLSRRHHQWRQMKRKSKPQRQRKWKIKRQNKYEDENNKVINMQMKNIETKEYSIQAARKL